MATIDVGAAASNRSTVKGFSTGYTYVDRTNPANDTGVLDTFEIYAVNGYSILNTKVGTFSGSSKTWDDRDYETIGTVTSGSKQTFTGKNCDVSAGDIVGIYGATGRIESDGSGYDGVCYITGDQFGAGSASYTEVGGDCISLYATGATAGGATVKPHYYYLQQ
jgi:hypothetical protein